MVTPHLWNSLSSEVCQASSLQAFHKVLNMELYWWAFFPLILRIFSLCFNGILYCKVFIIVFNVLFWFYDVKNFELAIWIQQLNEQIHKLCSYLVGFGNCLDNRHS